MNFIQLNLLDSLKLRSMLNLILRLQTLHRLGKNNVSRSLLNQHLTGALNVTGVHEALYGACGVMEGSTRKAPTATAILRYLKLILILDCSIPGK